MGEGIGNLQEASEHFLNLINHAAAGHIDADTARRRFLEYLGDTSPTERARMRRSHFEIPDPVSLTADEWAGLGTATGPNARTAYYAHEDIKRRLGYDVDLIDGKPVRRYE